jgi:2-oxoglutarate dehydrogenase E1 component
VFENIFETVNSGFAQALYEDYLRDPSSVPEEWRKLFDTGFTGEEPVAQASLPTAAVTEPPTLQAATPPPAPTVAPSPAEAPSGAKPTPPETTATPGDPIEGPSLRLLQNMEASLELPTATSFREVDVSLPSSGGRWCRRRNRSRPWCEPSHGRARTTSRSIPGV